MLLPGLTALPQRVFAEIKAYCSIVVLELSSTERGEQQAEERLNEIYISNLQLACGLSHSLALLLVAQPLAGCSKGDAADVTRL